MINYKGLNSMKMELIKVLSIVSARQRQIIELYLDCNNKAEVGRKLGVSRQTIRQQIDKAIKKAKKAIK